jgi:predicted transposase YdaD
MSSKNSQEHQIEKSAHLILSIDLEDYKVKNLVKSIAYLLADKFLADGDKKTAICDALGGKMNAVFNYGKRQKDEGIKEGKKEGIAEYMIKEGKTDQEIQKETGLTPEEIQKLKFKRNQIPIPEI